jgi:hypothetical protein
MPAHGRSHRWPLQGGSGDPLLLPPPIRRRGSHLLSPFSTPLLSPCSLLRCGPFPISLSLPPSSSPKPPFPRLAAAEQALLPRPRRRFPLHPAAVRSGPAFLGKLEPPDPASCSCARPRSDYTRTCRPRGGCSSAREMRARRRRLDLEPAARAS